MSAEIHSLPNIGDDLIEVRTGLPLLDVCPATTARFFRSKGKPWDGIALWFNNISCETLEITTEMLENVDGGDSEKERFMSWVLISMGVAVAQTLDELNATEPECDASLVLFALSANPMHRRAARSYTLGQPSFFNRIYAAIDDFGGLLAWFNLNMLTEPGSTLLWNSGIPDGPGVTFSPPEKDGALEGGAS